MKYKVLVFPCGSEIGLEIHNALKYSTHIELFGASSVSNHGKFVYKNYIGGMPDVEQAMFVEKLNEVIERYNIDFVFPAHDSVVLKLAQNQAMIKCRIIGSGTETCEICRSKSRTYEIMEGIVDVPRVYSSLNVPKKFPVFLKPDVGQGSKGTHIANSPEEIEFYKKQDPSLLIQEYLPGEEYTVDCFTDKEGSLLFSAARKRGRISNGISVNTYPANDAIFKIIAEKINKRIKLRGMWFFQVKMNVNGKPFLLEIAPRVAGSMALYRNLGVNFALLSVFDALDISVSIKCNEYPIEMDRALANRFALDLKYKHVYIDLDDTIVLDSKVNSYVMMFLYQCINENIKIHLLSRHKERFGEDIEKYLKRFRILDIFDSIINVRNNERKSAYVEKNDSIFIDDSFAERKEVSEEKKVPVFDVSSLESLINWKQ